MLDHAFRILKRQAPSDRVGLEDLTPAAPPACWDGYFLIGIFPEGSPIRWLKLHLYRGTARPGRYPIASLEGLGGAGQVFHAFAFDDGITFRTDPLSTEDFLASKDRFEVEVPGRIRFEGRFPDFSVTMEDPKEGLRCGFRIHAQDKVEWCRFGNFLTYWGLHSAIRGEVEQAGKKWTLEGFAILEHAWGTDLRIPPHRIVPGVAHWDVCAFHPPLEPHSGVAALTILPFGKRSIPFRGGGRIPGIENARFRGLTVEYLDWGSSEYGCVPLRWKGSVVGREGRLRYTATAAGPPAPVFEGGAFFGFNFDGLYEARDGRRLELGGTGFTELIDIGGYLTGVAGR